MLSPWGAPLQDGCSSECRAAPAGCPEHESSQQGGVLLPGNRASASAVKLQLTCSIAPAQRWLTRKSPSSGVLQLASSKSAAGVGLKGSSSRSPPGALLEDGCEGQSGSGCDAGACELLPGSICARTRTHVGRARPQARTRRTQGRFGHGTVGSSSPWCGKQTGLGNSAARSQVALQKVSFAKQVWRV